VGMLLEFGLGGYEIASIYNLQL